MRVTSIAINPRKWLDTLSLALRNSGKAFVDLCRSARLWIAVGASVAVHVVVILLSVLPQQVPAGPVNPGIVIEVPEDPSYPPKAPEIINKPGSHPGPIIIPTNHSEVVSKPEITVAEIDPDVFEVKGLDPADYIIVSDNSESLEDILARPPRSLEPTTIRVPGSVFKPWADFDIGDYSPPGTRDIPVVETNPGNPGTVSNPVSANPSESGFSLEGDLTRADIISAPLPNYPEQFKSKGLSNVVVSVKFTVNSDGRVTPTTILRRSSGYSSWDADVQKVLRR